MAQHETRRSGNGNVLARRLGDLLARKQDEGEIVVEKEGDVILAGRNLFVIQAIEPSVTYAGGFLGMVPFRIVIGLLLAAVLLFPTLALWLPATLQ